MKNKLPDGDKFECPFLMTLPTVFFQGKSNKYALKQALKLKTVVCC